MLFRFLPGMLCAVHLYLFFPAHLSLFLRSPAGGASAHWSPLLRDVIVLRFFVASFGSFLSLLCYNLREGESYLCAVNVANDIPILKEIDKVYIAVSF